MSQFSSVAQLCPTLWPHGLQACQASLSITNSWSLLKLMSIQSVMPSNLLILCCPLLLLPSIFSSTRVFSNESALCIMWPKYWSFSFSNEYSGLISFRIHWLDLLAVERDSRVFSNTTVQKHQFFSIIAVQWVENRVTVNHSPVPRTALCSKLQSKKMLIILRLRDPVCFGLSAVHRNFRILSFS